MYQSKPNSPWLSLMILLGLTFACTFVLQLFVVLGIVFSSGDINSILNSGGNIYPEDTNMLYLLLGVSSISTFLLPALFLQMIEKRQVKYFPSEPYKVGTFLILIFAFLIVFNPAMELISRWNMDMKLPSFLENTENWMRSQEDQMAELTERLVMVDRIDLLLLNILVMAVLPAIVEEFYFRGALQKIFERMFKNAHVAIWVTAIIFSAIHVQFYGFFPRMFLGLIFGYALLWTNNIWVPVFAHFLNNVSVTIIAFLYFKDGKTYEDLQNSDAYSVPLYIGSIILSIGVGYYFYKISQQKNKVNGLKLDENQSIQ
ncbi:CPBP family intramembrane glutamic endopeptidase [Sphingobacterium daejeonense]|uniref:CPBP family intramembrane glutamic endopeptidase n=1 Tax=Sphingobacterium daejeonense TaxID=371142 RepID=A0ABW3RGA6_9SPHI